MELRQVVDLYHAALDEFSRGNSLPVKNLYSRRDDVILANPFGPPVRGWKPVNEALDFASSRFRDGEFTGFETISIFETSELATIFELEHWKAKVSGRKEVTAFELRVTTTFRYEDDDWKIVHRHADPITTFHPDGPLRGSAS